MAYEEEMNSIVANILQSMLSWEVNLKTSDEVSVDENAESLYGNISITGDWQGSFIVKMPLTLAQKVAETMFDAEPGKVTEDETKDALGELTNMIGGSFKSMLEGSCQLSLPSVIQGKVVNPGTSATCHLIFETREELFEVTVLQANK